MQEFVVEFFTELLVPAERDPQRVLLTACILSGRTAAHVQAEARTLRDGVAANAVDSHGETLEAEAVGVEVTPLETFLERLRTAAAIVRNDQAEAVNRAEEQRE